MMARGSAGFRMYDIEQCMVKLMAQASEIMIRSLKEFVHDGTVNRNHDQTSERAYPEVSSNCVQQLRFHFLYVTHRWDRSSRPTSGPT